MALKAKYQLNEWQWQWQFGPLTVCNAAGSFGNLILNFQKFNLFRKREAEHTLKLKTGHTDRYMIKKKERPYC